MGFFFGKKQEKVELEFPKEIEIAGKKYEIIVDFVKKKSSSVNVKNSSLNFRLSSMMSSKEKQEHFATLFKKIVLKIEKKPLNFEVLEFSKVLANGEFYFANEKYLIEHTKNRGVKLKDNVFLVNAQTKLDVMEKYILKILCKKYTQRITEYVIAINKQYFNYELKEVELKLVNSKWGHCTHDNKLMLNLKLLNADIEILNYVIFHELAHIKVKNHSDRFWNEVQKICPNYKVLRKSLKDNPPRLYIIK